MGRSELECESALHRMGSVYNANTPENHPLIFATDQDYKAAMSILAVCAGLYPDVKVYAFQLMSNHVHFIIGGSEGAIYDFFEYFVSRLNKYFTRAMDLSSFRLKLFKVSDLAYLRNAIAYVNRNGFVVNSDVTPFSYPWGSGRYFFQPIACKYDKTCGREIGVVALRSLMHSRACDHLKYFKTIDGYISPLEFCHVTDAENVFRDAKQYFYSLSRNIEANSEVAKSIGEAIYYTDSDLYSAASKMAKENFDNHIPKLLPIEAKLEIAKRLHYDYNAGYKQLNRLLGIDMIVLNALF